MYNIVLGGSGGWDYVNKMTTHERRVSSGKTGKKQLEYLIETDKEYRKKFGKSMSKALKLYWKQLRETNIEKYNERMTAFSLDWTGLKHTEEAKEKMRETHRKNKHQQGSKNSQYGTIWIYSLKEKRSKRIKKIDPIPEGWFKGRKIKFN